MNPSGPADAAFLLKLTGAPIASWSRGDVAQEVANVMTATLWGSLTTLLEAFGVPSPPSMAVETPVHRILLTKAGSHSLLALVAEDRVSVEELRAEASRLLKILSDARSQVASTTARVGVAP